MISIDVDELTVCLLPKERVPERGYAIRDHELWHDGFFEGRVVRYTLRSRNRPATIAYIPRSAFGRGRKRAPA